MTAEALMPVWLHAALLGLIFLSGALTGVVGLHLYQEAALNREVDALLRTLPPREP